MKIDYSGKLFPSRYPIVEAIMNRGSTPALAAAVDEAGAFPSLYLSDKMGSPGSVDVSYDILKEFRALAGHGNVLVNMEFENLFSERFFCLIEHFKISHIELWATTDKNGNLLDFDSVYGDPGVQQAIKKFRSLSKILVRLRQPTYSQNLSLFDGVCIKGIESAGVSGEWPVEKLFLHQKDFFQSQKFIPYGGVGTPEQVKSYLDLGAPAVAVGTLFAMSKESPLSDQTKNSIIEKSKIGPTRTEDTKQNLILLDNNSRSTETKDWNRHDALEQGMTGNGQQGFVYIGHGIKNVESIRTVKETVEYLTQSIREQ